ncbi:UDP-N-acetylmuramoyl-L-alanine--D-glutamate ligase [Oceanobacter mangrovi]|uniref:UDP-N-acetylmuramoyl-L-alanine--D-glutamate ligase n=1 Tax=Oceanobacter mangrovi TaxID=2862510 RepID=UPI001C8E72BF|nr:UDP-N-acetylmuramoyl-L-alanine--D-glutamate ligase [Oceanobacter mangrovi]
MTATVQQPANIKRLIVGLGLSGLATARYCQRMGWPFDLCDSRARLGHLEQVKAEFPHTKVTLGALDGEQLSQYQQLIVSPGIALAEPAIQQALAAGVEVVGDVELFARHNDSPVIAITGSNGKSTVTTLVRDILVDAGLNAVMAGNIGVPVLDLLAQPDSQRPDVVVLELSSFQLETTDTLKPRAATILNVSEDHMDRYEGMADYTLAKQRIFHGAEAIIVNRDDAATLPVDGLVNLTGFTLKQPQEDDFGVLAGELDGQAGEWIVRAGVKLVHSSQLKIRGRHNLANVMAALALVETVGVSPSQALVTLQQFGGLPHRCEWVADVAGVTYINDSKGTNVGSTLAAIEGFAAMDGEIWLLAGGDGKGQDFSPLADACLGRVQQVCCYGKDALLLQDALQSSCLTAVFETLDEAFDCARQSARSGDLVLLSPACASLDQFANYNVRGEHFRQLARGLS